MLFTITTTHEPATDLGYLLYKNPARTQSFDLSFGKAHVFYPEATLERCTAALLLDIDPVALVRGGGAGSAIDQYVNDRPYVASSFLSVAIAQVYGTALGGKSRDRPQLADQAIPLEAKLSVVPCRGGDEVLHRLFRPLGYEVEAHRHALDPVYPHWGESRYFTLNLRARMRLADLLRHLYVLIPVLDDQKHYWVGDDEVEKLLRQGEGWLTSHPERDLIARRYLRHRKSLARDALAQLTAGELQTSGKEPEGEVPDAVAEEERGISLNQQRLEAVAEAIHSTGATRAVDLGCGEGRLLKMLLRDRQLEEILGMDVSIRSLEIALERLRLTDLPPNQGERVRLIHGSLMYRDRRIEGFDAAAVVEVIEHLDPPRLKAFERVLFGFARPATVVMTTPNREYNQLWETLPAGAVRHGDHRFEWTREEFQTWAEGIGDAFGYVVSFRPVGPEHPVHGSPTQMAVFSRIEAEPDSAAQTTRP